MSIQRSFGKIHFSLSNIPSHYLREDRERERERRKAFTNTRLAFEVVA